MMGDRIEKLEEDLEVERQSHAETKREIMQLTAEKRQLEREKEDSIREKDVLIKKLRNELDIARGKQEQELSIARKALNDERAPSSLSRQYISNNSPRPIIFLDIDGVLNFTKHNKQIQFEATLLKRLKTIIEKTNALIVLSTFWRHFHEYITYVFHRHGIDVASCMLPLPMGATRGKQTTKKFLHHHRLKQEGTHSREEVSPMIGRSAEDDAEYSSRAEEIEAWLQMYGRQYLGGGGDTNQGGEDDVKIRNYDWHDDDWKYVILDDRPSAAKPDTPLFDRFVHTDTKVGITDDEAKWAIELLLFGPYGDQTRPARRTSLDDIFIHGECNISPDLAVLLTPDQSPSKQQQQDKNQPSQDNDANESLKSLDHNQQCESEILAAMCDYSNVCPTLIALLQPQSMDDNDDYCPLPTMMKSFGEEKKTSFDEIENQFKDVDGDRESKGCDGKIENAESFDSITDNNENPIPAASPPPMNLFQKFPSNFAGNTDAADENQIDIGLDDLSHRWQASSLSAAVGAPSLTTKDNLNEEPSQMSE